MCPFCQWEGEEMGRASKREFPWGDFSAFFVRPQGDGNLIAVNFLRSRGRVPEEAETSVTVDGIWMQVYRLSEQELKDLAWYLYRVHNPEAFRYFGKEKSTEEIRELTFVELLNVRERADYLTRLCRKKQTKTRRRSAMTAARSARPNR